MAFVGPLDAFNSNPIQTKVGTSQTNIFTATSTKVNKDNNGKVIGGKTTLYYSPTAGNYVPAAETSDGGKTWTYLKDSNGKEILGTDAKNSLEKGALKANTQQQIISATTKPLGGGLSKEEQKTVAESSKNQGSPEGDTALITEAVELDIQGSGEGRESEGSFGDWRYPEGIQNNNQDRIVFTMVKYQPQQFSSFAAGSFGSLGGFDEKRKGEEVRLGTVTLPVTPGISESNGVEWGSGTMTASEAILANTALSGIKSGLGAAANTLGGVASAVQENPSDVKNAIANYFTQQATGASEILSRTQGAVFNPNMALLFRGPTLRPFTFSFKLSPRSSSEAKQVIKIIRFFKQGMSPLKSKSNLFLKAPHTFKIKYQYKLQDHPYIGQIKECALQNLVVNYTPEGQYGTFTDGVMFSYEIQMTFQELEPVFNEDYGTGDFPDNLLFKEQK